VTDFSAKITPEAIVVIAMVFGVFEGLDTSRLDDVGTAVLAGVL